MSKAPKAIPEFPGYRVYPDGRIESEWSRSGSGKGRGFTVTRSGRWSPLSPNGDGKIKLKKPGGGYATRSVRKLVTDLFPANA